MKPKITLISWTNKPIESVYALWKASKNEEPLLSVDEIDIDQAIPLFKKIISQNIPVSEHINFIFMLENVSVSFREQMVRHRIGVKVGENFGIDIIPNLQNSTWWSQSMRIQDMSEFANNSLYRIAETIEQNPKSKKLYKNAMIQIQTAYKELVNSGVPMEDARDLIPLGAQHRISWALNLSAIQHIIGKRSCWILQAGLWFPVISGIIKELSEKVHPVFRDLANPPCIGNDNCFNDCVYKLENERRITLEDKHDPCPLWMYNSYKKDFKFSNSYKNRVIEYRKLWDRNTNTGKKHEKKPIF